MTHTTKELEWCKVDQRYGSEEFTYTLISFDDGFLMDFNDQYLGHGFTLEEAKEVASKHYKENNKCQGTPQVVHLYSTHKRRLEALVTPRVRLGTLVL